MKTPVIAIPTQKISKLVQEQVFKLGYVWGSNSTEFNEYLVRWYGKGTFICLDLNKRLCFDRRKYFLEGNSNYYKEISLYDLYQIKSDETKLYNKNEQVIEILEDFLVKLKKARIN